MVPPPSDNAGKCRPVNSAIVHVAKTLTCLHAPLSMLHAPIHLPQIVLTIPSEQPPSSFAAYIAPHTPIHVLPPNSSRPPPVLLSNRYALPPTDLSYYLDVKNPQIHSTFDVGECSAHSNPNVQTSSSGITQQQLEGLQKQIVAIEAII